MLRTERFRDALQLVASAPEAPPPPIVAEPGAPVDEYPPRLRSDDLSAAAVREAVGRAGCVLVPSLLTPELAADLVSDIDRVFDGFDHHHGRSGTGDPWFDAFIPEPASVHTTRPWLRKGGGVFTFDSPRFGERWVELLQDLGIVDLVTEILGEHPITSLDKCALRKVAAGDGIEWHQDGSFLGPESGALNLWVSLSDTQDAPGLEIVSRRFTEIVETGTGGATYDWSTGPEVIAELAEDSPIANPHFRPGDGLLFDGLLLHRTAQPPPSITVDRYAIETWFFRPSSYPSHQQVPIAI